MRKSLIFFCVIGSPICTAETGEASSNTREENVAPWMPSFPMRPPIITALSPGLICLIQVPSPAMEAGIIPPVPQNTSGFPVYESSKRKPPATVGIPDWFPPSIMPWWTPLITAFGWRSPDGISSSGVSGFPKQRKSVLNNGRAPLPVPIISRFTPTIPVIAPPYGSSADGEL